MNCAVMLNCDRIKSVFALNCYTDNDYSNKHLFHKSLKTTYRQEKCVSLTYCEPVFVSVFVF